MKYRLEFRGLNEKLNVRAEVRVMPGNPNAKWASQREPYVKHNSNGKFYDKNGGIVSTDDPSAHIPLNEYDFEKLSKLIPYD